jgi:hypothetical protein
LSSQLQANGAANLSTGSGNKTMSETLSETDWPISKLEGEVAGLRHAISIMVHMNHSHDEVSPEEWDTIADLLSSYAERIEKLWHAAWKRDIAQREEHCSALDAIRAEKELPGSKADLERAEGLWVLLRTLVRTTAERCAEAGYPLHTTPDERQPRIGFE